LAGSRALIPDANHLFEPDQHMRQVVACLHYLPDRWKGKFHRKEVCAWMPFDPLYVEILCILPPPFF
jgi:hypothetical protein